MLIMRTKKNTRSAEVFATSSAIKKKKNIYVYFGGALWLRLFAT